MAWWRSYRYEPYKSYKMQIYYLFVLIIQNYEIIKIICLRLFSNMKLTRNYTYRSTSKSKVIQCWGRLRFRFNIFIRSWVGYWEFEGGQRRRLLQAPTPKIKELRIVIRNNKLQRILVLNMDQRSHTRY